LSANIKLIIDSCKKSGETFVPQRSNNACFRHPICKLGVISHYLAGQDFYLLSLALLYKFRFSFNNFYKRHEALHVVCLVLFAANILHPFRRQKEATIKHLL